MMTAGILYSVAHRSNSAMDSRVVEHRRQQGLEHDVDTGGGHVSQLLLGILVQPAQANASA
jgi:hypothetical protein